MGRIWTLVHKDFAIFVRDPVAMGLSFAVPLVMILVFGMVFGGEGGRVSIKELKVLGVNLDEGPAGARLLASLDAQGELDILDSMSTGGKRALMDSSGAHYLVESGKQSVALILPRDFSEGIKQGELRATMLEDPANPVTAGIVVGMIQKQAFSLFPGLFPMAMTNSLEVDSQITAGFNEDLRDAIEKNYGYRIPDSILNKGFGLFPEDVLLGGGSEDDRATSGGPDMEAAFKKMVNIEREQVVGEEVSNPGVAQSVAGTAVLFMLFGVGAIAASLLREMHTGMVQRIVVSGVTAGQVLLSKYVYAVIMGSVQLIVMMIYGWLIFSLEIFRHWPSLLVMIGVTAIVMSGLGLIITALSRTEEQASGIQVVVILSISAVGGAMFPSFMMPGIVQAVASFTPVYWAMQGFTDIFWRNQSFAGIVLECGILLGMSVLFVGIAIAIFRKRLAVELE